MKVTMVYGTYEMVGPDIYFTGTLVIALQVHVDGQHIWTETEADTLHERDVEGQLPLAA